MAYDRLAEAIIKHSKLIVVAWIVILLVAIAPAIGAFSSMSYDIDDMGLEDSESMEGMVIISDYFPSSDSGSDATSSPMLVFKYDNEEQRDLILGNPDSSDPMVQIGILDYLNAMVADGMFGATDENGAFVPKVAGFAEMMDSSESNPQADGSGIIIATVSYDQTWVADGGDIVEDTPTLRDQIVAALAEPTFDDPIEIALTGSPAISYDMETGAMNDVSHIDVFTILMVIILVGLFFRSFITSFTPPLTIVFALVITLGVVYGLMFLMDIFFLTEMLLIVSMFGAGCDYCIFIIARYREEMRDGKDHHDALHSAIKWAGESITISGASVIIGFGAMSICSFSMISTMGICLAIGIIIALLAALTFIPSVLNIVGDRIFWPTRIKEYQPGGKATKGWFAWAARVGHSYFERSSHFTLKHAKAITVVAILVTVPAAYVAATSETSYDMTSSLMTGESDEGMQLIGDYADQGMIYPNYVVMEYGEPIATISESFDPITGDPAGYSLEWSDGWRNTYSPALNSELDSIMAGDENISTAYGPYMWEESVAEAMAALGYDLPTALLNGSAVMDYISEHAHSTEKIVLDIAIPQIQAQFGTFIAAGAFDDIDVGSLFPGLPAGSTLSSVYNSMPMLQATITDAVIIVGGASTIDYIVNSNLGLIGGDFATSEDGTGSVTYIKVTSSTHEAAMSQTSMDSISYMNGAIKEFAADPTNGVAATWFTGSAAIMYDISNVISDEFTNIEIIVIILIIILLFFVMRSYTIPFRSVLTILMSICWTLAATHLIFGDSVTWLIPLILLVVCLGLGMDYDILLTTRIKENVRANGMSNDDAIHHAVIHSGSVITICGLIMGGAFGTLMLSSMEMLQQFGFALCFAIVVDALIVRTYVVPAVMKILGDLNWKGPKFLMTKAEKQALAEKAEAEN